MKAAVLWKRRTPLAIEDLELADPAPGEARIKVGASGVCHSDLNHVQRETWATLPIVLGHEAAGTVEAVGSNVTRVKPGQRVIAAFGMRCGECHFCVRGQPYLCATALPSATQLRKGDTPIQTFSGVGSFAEYINVDARNLVPIPDEMPIARACLIACGVATGIGAVLTTAQVEPGATVAVFGIGGVGLNVVQGARLAGASRIIAVDRVPLKLELARQFGATHVIDAGREDAVERIKALTGGWGADYIFEVIGNPKTLMQAVEATSKGGKTVIVGIAPEDAEISLSPVAMLRSGKSVTGCMYGSARPQYDFPRYVDLYLNGRIMLGELISREFALDEINEAFAAMEAGEVARGVVVFN